MLIHSNPGISTELSATKPEDILVTDFFGGVASVEVIPGSKSLSPIGRKHGTWQVSKKDRASARLDTLGSSGAARPMRAPRGWRSPLVQEKNGLDGIKTGITLGVLGLFGFVAARAQFGRLWGKQE